MILKNKEDWEVFKAEAKLPYARGRYYNEPERYPCFMTDDPITTDYDSIGPYMEYFGFFYPEDAKELLAAVESQGW